LTGHLVLSTIHTNSAAGAIPRMLDMGAEPFLIASTINVIVGQRLVRTLVHKEKYFLDAGELETLGQSVDLDRMISFLKKEGIIAENATWKEVPFYRPKPTKDSDGFKGRIGIHEVFKISSATRELIIKRATSEQIEEQAKKEGMMTMLEDGIFKAVQGFTTLEEVLRVISE